MTPRRRAAGLTIAVGMLAGVVGCAPPRAAVVGSHWQVVGIFADPAEPGGLPQDAAGTARFVFGPDTVSASTGCENLKGAARFTKEGDPSNPEDADAVAFGALSSTPAEEECLGGRAHVDRQLDALLNSGEFGLSRPSDSELRLIARSQEIDPPVIRLSAL